MGAFPLLFSRASQGRLQRAQVAGPGSKQAIPGIEPTTKLWFQRVKFGKASPQNGLNVDQEEK